MKKDNTKIKVKYVSYEYCVDNFYMDYKEGYIYENEDAYLLNKRTPVYNVIDMSLCGTIADSTIGEMNNYMADFVEEFYTVEKDPEYFV